MNGDAGALLLVCIGGPLVLGIGGMIYLGIQERRRNAERQRTRLDFEQHRREQRKAEREARKERKGPR